MGRTSGKLSSFCLSRIRPHVRVRSPPIPIQSKPVINTSTTLKNDDQKNEHSGGGGGDEKSGIEGAAKLGVVIGRKVMIVVDSSLEAKGALNWALSHTVQSQDIVILLYVSNKPSKPDEGSSKEIDLKVYEFLHSLKITCQLKRPEVQIEVAVVEAGKDKGPAIVAEAKKQEAAMLVLGQKRRSMTWRLVMMWAGSRLGGGGGGGGGSGVVEYCIQNAGCMAIAVRRKNKKLGGYLITTKRHRDFWLLA